MHFNLKKIIAGLISSGILVAIYILFIFLNNYRLYPNFEISPSPIEFFKNYTVIKVGYLNNQVLSTLSATYASKKTILLVVLTTFILLFIFKYIYKFKVWETFLLVLVTLGGNLYLLMQIDDLPDEGYVWASKIDSFIQYGRLGVKIYLDNFGESTVGFLQFILATIPRFFGLTIEQSIYYPLWIIFTVSQILIIKIVGKYTKSYFLSILICGIIYISPVIGFNFALGFDSIIAYSFLIIWLYFELVGKASTRSASRIMLFSIFPIIRLDFGIVSLGIFILHIDENKLISFNTVLNEIKSNKIWYLLSSVLTIQWMAYKLWAFGDIIPAMASYKSFHNGSHLIFSGFNYILESLNLRSIFSPLFLTLSFLLLFNIFLWLVKNVTYAKKIFKHSRKLNSKLRKLLYLNLFFFFFTSTLSIFAGGDYFGPQLMRYQFPFLISIQLILLLIIINFSKSVKTIYNSQLNLFNEFFRLDNFFFVFLILFTTVLFFKPNDLRFIIDDMKHIEKNGRVSCEAAAAYALKKEFPSANFIATPEVNGVAYHANLKLIDLIGLVDTNVITDGFIGDSKHKFRIMQSTQQIKDTDILWLYPASECSKSKMKLTQENDYSIRLQDLINSWPGKFRVLDFNSYIEQGFAPFVIEFKFNSAGEVFYGKAFTFVNLQKNNLIKRVYIQNSSYERNR